MNAYQIMIFLLLFNVSVSVVLSLGIYNSMPAGSNEVPISDEQGLYTNTSLSVDSLENRNKADLLSLFGGNILAGLVIGTVMGGTLSYITQIPGDSAFAYSMFISFYWTMAKNTVDILYNLAGAAGSNNIGLLYIIVIFIVILGITFLSFLIQLVRGPWATMR